MSGQRIGLFGGTFDPVHAGHVAMAAVAREAAGLDRVVVIPCRISPHKVDGPPAASGQDRMEMLRLAFADLPWAQVDDCELKREEPSYSWRTAEDFHARDPVSRLFWIMGEDQWSALPRWDRPERLADLVEFLVFTRDDRDPQPRSGYRARFLRAVHPASATALRRSFARGELAAEWVPPRVMGWIRDRRLYGVR